MRHWVWPIGSLLGCNHGLECTAEALGPNAVRVEWSPSGAASVSWQSGTDPELSVQSSGADYTMAGLGALEDVVWTVEVDGRTCEGTTRTLNLLSGLPDFTVSVENDDSGAFGALVGTVWGTTGTSRVFAIDRHGGWRFERDVVTGSNAFDAVLSTDGDIVANESDADRAEDLAWLRRTALDGTERENLRTRLAHHVFEELSDGTLAWLQADVRSWTDPATGETMDVVGDAIVETTPGGGERTVTSTWDWLPVTRSRDFDSNFYPIGKDWTHANSVHFDPSRDTYLLSLHNLTRIVEIDRTTGAPVRTFALAPLGADLGFPEVLVADGSLRFSGQHDVRWEDDGSLRMFATDTETGWTGGVTYREVDGALVETRRVGFDDRRSNPFLGQFVPLPDGSDLLVFPASGVVQQRDASGVVGWELKSSQGALFGNLNPVAQLVAAATEVSP